MWRFYPTYASDPVAEKHVLYKTECACDKTPGFYDDFGLETLLLLVIIENYCDKLTDSTIHSNDFLLIQGP